MAMRPMRTSCNLPVNSESVANRPSRPTLNVECDLPDPHSARSWPIAAAMLQFPGTIPDGTAVSDVSPDTWAALLAPIVAAGFSELEIPSAWLRLGDLPQSRLSDFIQVIHNLNLTVSGVSVVRESIIHPVHGTRNLDFSHRTIDAAAAIGATIVCLGLHDALLPAQKEALWFWTQPGTQKPADPSVQALAVARYRELAEHAQQVGLEISLEMYEDTYLGSADEAVAFIEEIGHDAAGLNPDIGNIIRLQRPIEAWEYLLVTTLPYANYWHVKNYTRMEDPHRNIVLTAPAPLEFGIINYRTAVHYAISQGFQGAFVVEHYGGDGLSVSATNRDYLRRLLASPPHRTISATSPEILTERPDNMEDL
jgi:sugar phosphate isomerase/epimerase